MRPLLRAIAIAAVLYALAGICIPAVPSRSAARWTTVSHLTYYRLVGYTASGEWTHDGGAACPRAYLGATVHVLEPDVWLTCNDTGAAWYFETGGFPVDVWSPSRPWWMTDDYYTLEVQ